MIVSCLWVLFIVAIIVVQFSDARPQLIGGSYGTLSDPALNGGTYSTWQDSIVLHLAGR